MNAWPIVPLGEVATLNPRLVEPLKDTDKVAIVPMASLDADAATTTSHVTVPYGDVNRGYTTFRNEDILVAKITPCFENSKIGVANISTDVGFGSTEFYVVRPKLGKVDRDYIIHLIRGRHFIDTGTLRMTGSGGQRRVPLNTLRDYEIPLPPVEEQRRIAAALKSARRAATATTVRARKLAAMRASQFGRIADRVTDELPLGDLVSIRSGNSLPVGVEFMDQPAGSLLLRVSDLNRSANARRVTTASRWSPDGTDHSTSAVAGSVVLPKRGGAIGTNKKRVLGRTAQLDPNLMGLTPGDERCPTEWLAAWLDTIDLGTLANGSSVPQINKKDIKDLKVPVASVEDLKLFQQISQKIGRLQSSVQQQTDVAHELYESLQYRAFRGEL